MSEVHSPPHSRAPLSTPQLRSRPISSRGSWRQSSPSSPQQPESNPPARVPFRFSRQGNDNSAGGRLEEKQGEILPVPAPPSPSSSPPPYRPPPHLISRRGSSSSVSLASANRWSDILSSLSSLPPPTSPTFTLSLYRLLDSLKSSTSSPPPQFLPLLLPLLHALSSLPSPSSYFDLEQRRLTLSVALSFLSTSSQRGWAEDGRPVMNFVAAVINKERKERGEGKEERQPSWMIADGLRVLSHLLDSSPDLCTSQVLPLLMPSLEPPSSSAPPSPLSSTSASSSQVYSEERRLSILCLSSLALCGCVEKEEVLKRLLHSIEEQMREDRVSASTSSSSLLSSLLFSLHRILSAVFTQKEAAVDVPSLLSLFHRLLVRGVPLTLSNGHVNTGVDIGRSAAGAIPAPSVAHSFSPFASLSVFSPPSTRPALSPSTSSKVSLLDEQIRLASLSSLHLIATHQLRTFHLHWSAFVPSDTSSALSPRPFSGPHLLTVLLFDPSSSVRSAAASLLSLLFTSSPLSKAAAVNPRPNTGLTARYADITRGLHVGLLESLRKENSQEVQLAVMRALAGLAANIRYDQQTGLLSPLLTHLVDVNLPAVLHSSPSLLSRPTSRTSSVPSSPSSCRLPPSELRAAVFLALSSLLDHSVSDIDVFLSSHPSFISLLLSHASRDSDTWLPLSKVARRYPSHLLPFWYFGQPPPSLHTLIISSLFSSSSSSFDLRASALRLLDEWTRQDASELAGEEEEGGMREPSDGRLWEMEGVRELYVYHLPLLYREGGALRAKALTLFGFVPYSQWQLWEAQQLVVLECVKAAVKDETTAVRMASAHCLSLYALYSVRAGSSFVEEAVELLSSLLRDDSVIAVRARAAWAIANLCTTPHSFFLSFLPAVLEALHGSEKVMAHAVRALGNVGRWMEVGDGERWREMVNGVVRVMKEGRGAKMRWNAAYAIGNLVKNQTIGQQAEFTATSLLPPLLSILSTHLLSSSSPSSAPSFKVSINCASALSAPSRPCYGSFFLPILSFLLLAIPACDSLRVADYREKAYKESLSAHLRAALVKVLFHVGEQEKEVVRGGWKLIARIVLRERMRVESEMSRARLWSTTKKAAATVDGPAVENGVSRISLDGLELVVEKVSALLSDDERQQFIEAADGVSQQ